MLQKAYDQAKWCLVTRGYSFTGNLPIEVQVAMWKMINNLTHDESMRLYAGKLALADLDRFQAPSCKIK